MKSKIIAFFVISIVLFSCNKVKKLEKEITGDWSVLTYTYQNNQGFSYQYDGDGSFIFESCDDTPCPYELSLTYQINGISYLKNERGSYSVQNDAEHYTLVRDNIDGTTTTLDNGRVILVNKDQMKTFFQDEFGTHHFILQKN